MKRIFWPAVIAVSVVHIGALIALFNFSMTGLFLSLFFYIFTGLGITMGYHRYFTHRSFHAKPWLENLLAIAGSLSLQGPLKKWVFDHRLHHIYSDKHDDPHNSRKGLFWSHMGWMFFEPEYTIEQKKMLPRLMKDFKEKDFLNTISKPIPYLMLQVLVFGLVFLIFDWKAALWATFFRYAWVYHITWSVNSFSHWFGYKTYNSGDDSRNNIIVGFLALGEGWHNNHHAFPLSARHGLDKNQFDFTYLVIKFFEYFNSIKEVNLPSNEQKQGKKII